MRALRIIATVAAIVATVSFSLALPVSAGSSAAPSIARSSVAYHMPLGMWVGSGRADVVSGVQQGRWTDVLGQYLKETAPDFLNRPDVAVALAHGSPWSEPEGQWLREQLPIFWYRSDVQAAWSGRSPRKADVIGQGLIENGASIYLGTRASDLRVLLLSGGSLYYGARSSDSGAWTGFGNVTGSANAPASSYLMASADINGNLNVLLAATGSDLTAHLYYGVRLASGAWQPFTDLSSVVSVPASDSFRSVAAANVSGNLRVLLVTAAGHGALYDAVRNSSTGVWSGFSSVYPGAYVPGPIASVTAVGINGDLHVLLTAEIAANWSGQLYYGVHHSDGTWYGFVAASTLATVPDLAVSTFAVTAVNGNLNAVLTTPTGGLYQAIRSSNGSWSGFNNIADSATVPMQTSARSEAAAAVNGDLDVLISGDSGALYLGIRNSSNGTWSGFMNVASAGASVPSGPLTIACAAT